MTEYPVLPDGAILQSRYRIERKLGRGGMGAVYLAYDERFKNAVALKQAFFNTPELAKAFEREARLLRSLKHRSLPTVIDYFQESTTWYLVMDFVEGEDLAALSARSGRVFAPAEVVAWGRQLLDVLEYLHSQDPPVVHRDIKPQNVKLTPKGEVILLDFGLSKGTVAEMSRVAGGKSVAGYTPHFAPLEQIHGTGTDPRSDLYSLAATMYSLLTNEMPPDAGARAAAALSGHEDPLVLASAKRPSVPEPLARVLSRAMALNPNARPQSAAAFRILLEDAGREVAARAAAEARGWPHAAPPRQAATTIPERPSGPQHVQPSPAAPTAPAREVFAASQPKPKKPSYILPLAVVGVLLAFVIGIAAIVYPSLTAARRAANESAAIGNLRTIGSAEATYLSREGKPGRLSDLVAANMLDATYRNGAEMSGYRIGEVAVDPSAGTFEFKAEPSSTSSGSRAFNIIEDYTIRYNEGEKAPSREGGTVLGYSN